MHRERWETEEPLKKLPSKQQLYNCNCLYSLFRSETSRNHLGMNKGIAAQEMGAGS